MEFIEQGILTEKEFDGLSTTQAAAVVAGARRVCEQREASARKQQEEAERAARDAEIARQRREQAEKERKEREALAAAALKLMEAARRAQEQANREALNEQSAEDERRRARLEAENARKREERAEAAEREAREKAQQAEQERRAAEESRLLAERRKAAAVDAARREREEGRRAASLLGRDASKQIKAGKLTAQGVRDLSVAYAPSKQKTIPDIEKFTSRLMHEVDELFRADSLATKLNEIVQNKEHLDDEVRKDAASKLRRLSERVLKYAKGFWPAAQDASPKTQQLMER
jgi:hypothetical protein